MPIIIREEKPEDYFETENLTREAFWDLFQPGCDEHLILHKLRISEEFIPQLDLVACEGERIIAHIIYTKAQVKSDNDSNTVLCMGPLSVLPEFQGKGIGTKLLEYSIDRARQLGFTAVVIFGHPEYYHRFGFRNAGEYGIQTAEGKNMDAFMALDLQGDGLHQISGRFHESPAFQASKADLEEFEKKFPAKKKGKPKFTID